MAIADPARDPSGFWTGHFSYRDADLPVQVDIRKKEGIWQARLDIPSLVYADQSIALEEAGDGSFSRVFPFGIAPGALDEIGE